MNQRELEKSWKITRTHLEAAKRLLPPNAVAPCASLAAYEDYLNHNELELAFDMLEAIGEENNVPFAFWDELRSAAAWMCLGRKGSRCQTRLLEGVAAKLRANPAAAAEIMRLMDDRSTTIPAIKALREATGCGLGAAKVWLYDYWGQLTPNPTPTLPCPYCAQPLRTNDAKQCFQCGMDWHDPNNVIRNG